MLRERPTNLKRYPDGVDGEPFYAKRLPKGAPDYVETARVTFPSGRTAESLCPTEPAVLVWAANMGTFDFHPWPVRRADTDRPDELRIDLDPQPGTDFADAVAVAAVLREVLDEAGLVGWPKTSGGRGIHVFGPDPAGVGLRRRPARGDRDRPAGGRPAPGAGDRRVVEGGARRAGVPRLQPGRPRPHGRLGLVGARAAAGHGVDAGDLGRRCPTSSRRTSTCAPCPACSPSAATRTPGWTTRSAGWRPLLEWYAADERDRGLGDLPYPPEYPKMPGEPMRVQPSRARRDP